MTTLIIAEKPSVAGDIAKAIGGCTRNADGIWEGQGILISNAFGHLVGIDAPEAIANKTPVIPDVFDYVALPKTEDQLKKLLKLIARGDVDTLINACDAGREGELIFRRIVGYAKSSKPIKRMWLQSMTLQSLRAAYGALRTDSQMLPLAAAAVARSEADWIVGINGSRLCKRLVGEKTPVGRVQTPTLMIIVDREEAIKNFVSKGYFEVHLAVGLASGPYKARWTRQTAEGTPGDPKERIWQKADAQQILVRCQGRPLDRIVDVNTPGRSSAPTLFDLTTLQREANRLFGMSAAQTLTHAQNLYEKQKVLTYPRTDAKALPEDYIPTITRTVEALGQQGYTVPAANILTNGWIRPTKKVFDNSKISDHFAIVPTGKTPVDLSPAEQKIYDLVARRLLAVFHPDAEYAITVRTAWIGADAFVARGKVLVTPGWTAVYQSQDDEKDAESTAKLPALTAGEAGRNDGLELVTGKTKAPPRFNEATLLSAMEHAGKDIDDDAAREAMAEKGLGTPATRAATIEGLIEDQYIERVKKQLVPTDRAFALKALLIRMDAQALLSAALTGQWEEQLKAIEAGQAKAPAFMQEIKNFTLGLVDRAGRLAPMSQTNGPAVSCPTCSAPMRRIKGPKSFFWGCSGYPDCKTNLPDIDGKPGAPRSAAASAGGEAVLAPTGALPYPCPVCHKPLRIRTGGKGPFWGCSGYPGCNHTAPDDGGKPGTRVQDVAGRATKEDHQKAVVTPAQAPATLAKVGDACPTCKSGTLVQRFAKEKERHFLGCNKFPGCRYFQWLG